MLVEQIISDLSYLEATEKELSTSNRENLVEAIETLIRYSDSKEDCELLASENKYLSIHLLKLGLSAKQVAHIALTGEIDNG